MPGFCVFIPGKHLCVRRTGVVPVRALIHESRLLQWEEPLGVLAARGLIVCLGRVGRAKWQNALQERTAGMAVADESESIHGLLG